MEMEHRAFNTMLKASVGTLVVKDELQQFISNKEPSYLLRPQLNIYNDDVHIDEDETTLESMVYFELLQIWRKSETNCYMFFY